MSRARRQILGTFLGGVLCFLFYLHYYANNDHLPLSQPTSSPTAAAQTDENQISNDLPKKESMWKQLPMRYPVLEVQQVPVKARTFPKLQSTDHETPKPALQHQMTRQAAVKERFERCWKSYQSHAWAADGLRPLSGLPTNDRGGWGARILENLDTLWIMEMYEEFEAAVTAVTQIDFDVTNAPELNTPDLNTRLLGGLLAAYDLSNDQRLLTKCVELGDMLYAAFDTPNRMPIIHWDSHKASRREEQLAEEKVLTAELGSFTLEFTRLSQITGDSKYFDAAQRVLDLFDRQYGSTKLPGLWPVYVNARAESFDGDEYAIGAMGNSFYKTLPQAYALNGGQMPVNRRMYERFTFVAAGHNLFRPMNPAEEDILLLGTVHAFVTQNGKPRTHLQSQVHYQSCFAGGLFALGGALFGLPAHKRIAHKLVDGCIWAHEAMSQGIMPKVFDAVPCASQLHCPWNEWHWKQEAWKKANSLKIEGISDMNIDTFIKDHHLPKGFIDIPDTISELRPEVIESIFVLYRVTGREDLLDKAWELFESLNNVSATNYGNAAIVDVTFESKAPILSDSIENFWMSETLRYFYLIFGASDLISLDDFVFNAAGHPLRRPRPS
ncbi:unnamed protein product [Penicillium salamii]|nr:unnamed protein product [Penicillium salamii]